MLTSLSQILRAKEVDPRAELFTNAVKSGAQMESSTRKLLLRMKLCVVRLNSRQQY